MAKLYYCSVVDMLIFKGKEIVLEQSLICILNQCQVSITSITVRDSIAFQ